MHLLWAIILALLLCGCTDETEGVPSAATQPTTVSQGYYDEHSSLEQLTDGAIAVYPPDAADTYGLKAWGDDLLVFSMDDGFSLQILSGQTLIPTAQRAIPFPLSPDDPSLQIYGDSFSYYDPINRDVLVLDRKLHTVSRISVPEDLTGTPVLSQDCRTLFYCTANTVRAWNLETGIRRGILDLKHDAQSVTGLHCGDKVIECSVTDNGQQRTLFLSAENGSILHTHSGEIRLDTQSDQYSGVFTTGAVESLVFGDTTPNALTPKDLFAKLHSLPAQQAALSVFSPEQNRLRLEYYRLTDGVRTASLTWDCSYSPFSFTACRGNVWFLLYEPEYGRNVICRWNPEASPVSDNTRYTGPHYTADNPDQDGLERCRTYANVIGQQHGIQIRIGKDATAVQPWDYDLETEYLVPLLEEELHLLEQHLEAYPEGMLSDTASHFSSLTICLARSIHGSAESGSLDAATGIQFFDGSDAYVVIAPGKYARQALYHELFHVMETHLLTRPTALDRWEELNPNGFRYDYSYITNKDRDSGIYLSSDSRSFVDTYSMSFPKEDKARVMEYAMLPGMEQLFRSPAMQAKLRCLSQGLREGYGLENQETKFLWEQYLE